MQKQKMKKLGALWRVPRLRAVVQTANVMTVAALVIGMVTYAGLYNPRAGLEAAEKPPSAASARAAPHRTAESGAANNGYQVKLLDLTFLFSSNAGSTLSTADNILSGPPLEADAAVTINNVNVVNHAVTLN